MLVGGNAGDRAGNTEYRIQRTEYRVWNQESIDDSRMQVDALKSSVHMAAAGRHHIRPLGFGTWDLMNGVPGGLISGAGRLRVAIQAIRRRARGV